MTALGGLLAAILAGVAVRAIFDRVAGHRRRLKLLKALQVAVRSVRSSLSATLRASYGAMRTGGLPGMPVAAALPLLTSLRPDDLAFLPNREAELASELTTKLERLLTFRVTSRANIARANAVDLASGAACLRSEKIREKEVRDCTHLLTITLENAQELQNCVYRLTRRRTLIQALFAPRRPRPSGEATLRNPTPASAPMA